MLSARDKLWLIYKRLRTATGVTLGLVLIYAAYKNAFGPALVPLALGLWLIHLFGDLYNDYVDFSVDKRNKRKDKWTVSGFASRKTVKNIMLLSLVGGLALTNAWVFLLGLAYASMLAVYSSPRIGIRRYDFFAYVLIGIPMLFFPFAFNSFFSRGFSAQDAFFSIFAYSHYVYLYCQKDSTDKSDPTNLFIKRGWASASIVCVSFAAVACVALLGLTIASPLLMAVWAVHVLSKGANLYKISTNTIERTLRSRLILLEFLMPFLFVGGVFIA